MDALDPLNDDLPPDPVECLMRGAARIAYAVSLLNGHEFRGDLPPSPQAASHLIDAVDTNLKAIHDAVARLRINIGNDDPRVWAPLRACQQDLVRGIDQLNAARVAVQTRIRTMQGTAS